MRYVITFQKQIKILKETRGGRIKENHLGEKDN